MTLALAIVGAVTGVFGTVVALLTYFRDRPRLHVTIQRRRSSDHGKQLRLNLANHGRQPLSIVDAGVAGRKEGRQVGHLNEPWSTWSIIADEPLLLAPGQVKTFFVEEPHPNELIGPDEKVVTAWATDSRGRHTWSRSIELIPG